MANLTIVIPNVSVPILMPMVETYLTGKNIDWSAMTNIQKGQRYLAERIKDDYIVFQRTTASVARQATLDTAHANATAALNTAVASAVTEASGFTG